MILTDYDEEKTMEMFKREFREDGYSEGLNYGKQIGYDEGARDGEQRGYDKGAREGEQSGRKLEQQRIAIQMKTKGMSDEVIADMLSVTPERLNEILRADKVHES